MLMSASRVPAIGFGLALTLLAQPSQAATYTLNTGAGQEAAITAARTVYNNGLPACGAPTNNCAADPNYAAANPAYMAMVLANALTTWSGLTSVKATILPADQTNAQSLLNACISGGGGAAYGGVTSAQCQTLLTAVQGAR